MMSELKNRVFTFYMYHSRNEECNDSIWYRVTEASFINLKCEHQCYYKEKNNKLCLSDKDNAYFGNYYMAPIEPTDEIKAIILKKIMLDEI